MPDDPYQYPRPPHDPVIRPREPVVGPPQMTYYDLIQQDLALLHRIHALEQQVDELKLTVANVLAHLRIP